MILSLIRRLKYHLNKLGPNKLKGNSMTPNDSYGYVDTPEVAPEVVPEVKISILPQMSEQLDPPPADAPDTSVTEIPLATPPDGNNKYSKRKTAAKYASALNTARRIAAELGERGSVSINDIRKGMSLETANNNWMGSVFKGSSWVKICEVASEYKPSKGRKVGMWMRKSYLKQHSLDGFNVPISRFNLLEIYDYVVSAITASGNTFDPNKFVWIIGKTTLNSNILQQMELGNGRLFGINVVLAETVVGAMLAPAADLPVIANCIQHENVLMTGVAGIRA